MASLNLGKVGLLLRGDWDSDTDYAALDVVSHEGYAYAARVANKNVEPSAETAAYWQPLAESASVLATMLGYKNDPADSATAAAGSATAAATSASSATDALANEAADFSSSKAYAVGDYVIYNNGTHKYLYRFTAAHSAGAWVGTDAVQVALANDVSDLKSALDASAYYDDFVTDVVLCGNGFLESTGVFGSSSKWKLYSVDVSEVSKIDVKSYIRSITSAASPKMLWCFYDVIPTALNYTSLTADNVVQKGEVLSNLTEQEIERTAWDVPIGAKGMLVMIGTGYSTLTEPQVKGYKSVIKVIDENEIFSDTRNLFYVTDTTNRTSHHVQITFNDDGSFTLNGTSNAVIEIPIMGGIVSSDTNIEAGTYTYHIFCEPEYNGLAVGMRSGATGSSNIPPDVPFTLSSATNIFARIGTGKVYNNNRIWIEFEKGNTTGAYVKHTDKNKADIQARADIKQLKENISSLTIISDLKKRSYKPHMKYVSWRGLHLTVPENSIPSYELAGKSCFDVLNIARIRASADKTLWVMHNATVDATTDGTGSVSSLTDTYLSSLHLLYDGVATEYGIPTAEEAIQVCLKYGMIPMLRCYGFSSDTSATEWQNLFSLIDGYGIADRFLFSGSEDDIQRMINLYPNGIYVWHDDTESMTTEQMITVMNGFTGIGKDHLCAMLRDDATLTDAKAMHSAGYMIYDDHCRDITTELALKTRLADITAWGYDYANFYLIPPDTLDY